MSDFLSFKTSSPSGDLLSLLPSMRQLYRKTGKKAIVYQALNVVGQQIIDTPQPFKNQNGQSVMMAEETFKMLKPLLESQEYIESLVEFKGQEVKYDLDEMRLKTFCNQPLGSLHRFIWYVFPEMACDLSEQWLHVDDKGFDMSRAIIINFTNRYRNNWINYYFLKEHRDNLYFVGLKSEYEDFCNKWDLDFSHLGFADFHRLAILMKSCKLFMGNASMCFQIAEGLKIPRLLETFPPMPNVIPMGANGYDAYHQVALENYFNKLINQ